MTMSDTKAALIPLLCIAHIILYIARAAFKVMLVSQILGGGGGGWTLLCAMIRTLEENYFVYTRNRHDARAAGMT